jgi:uncharacterized damage-inducible protein DinB
MKLSAILTEELRRTFDGDAWHGPAIVATLQHITEEQARSQPIAGAHSILELVVHMTAWTDAVRRRIEGEHLRSSDVADWADVSAISFEVAVNALMRAHERLIASVDALSDEELLRTIAGKDYTAYQTVEFVIDHNVYHQGQIALLKKMT